MHKKRHVVVGNRIKSAGGAEALQKWQGEVYATGRREERGKLEIGVANSGI